MSLKKSLAKEDFKIYYSDIHWEYRFKKRGEVYHIYIEPCMSGFDVALYFEGKLVATRKCTKTGNYQEDKFHDKKRSDEDWNRALLLVRELVTEYFSKRQ